MTIRPAQADEAATLTDLAMRSKALWGYDRQFMAACSEELTYAKEGFALGTHHATIAEVGDDLAGFSVVKHLGQRQWELDGLFIDPDWVGQGIGKRLLQHALVLARSLGGERLLVISDPHAVGFYRHAGAQEFGTAPSGSIAGRQLPQLVFPL
ncbi:GNAT family N-acetyltransferase [Ferrimonas balearica]|uniref:GNAT family N-acetyltransferase n=1 Tax=Ferrimonas balearica TaxID=44012 RepID=UPI001C9A141B|nr:GNAT family N-acetyltransferase [Ferrimonas balearica]MBY5992605.1 GNAT family N-acetyltransferase [Ferrimonas balearica]